MQMMMIILLLLDWPGLQVLETAAIYLSVLLTIVSLVTYIYQNKKVLSMQE